MLRLTIRNANRLTNQRDENIAMIWDALFPLTTSGRYTIVIREFGKHRVNVLLRDIRGSVIPRKEYDLLAGEI